MLISMRTMICSLVVVINSFFYMDKASHLKKQKNINGDLKKIQTRLVIVFCSFFYLIIYLFCFLTLRGNKNECCVCARYVLLFI